MNPISVQNYRELVEPNVAERHIKIFKLIAQHPDGIHSKEICEILGKLPHQISGRFTELVKLDLIIVDRIVKVGKSNYGVWILTEKGKELLKTT